MNKAVRAAVFARADGKCEVSGCSAQAIHFDHHFGRAKAEETIENGWAHCLTHSEAKTASRPNAAFWQEMFIRHCAKQLERIVRSLNALIDPGSGEGSAMLTLYAEARRYEVAGERARTKLAVLHAKGHA